MATIKGVWTFKDLTPFTAPAETIMQAVNFTTADGTARTSIEIKDGVDSYPVLLNLDGWTVAIYNGEMEFRWLEEYPEYKTVDFGQTEQTVSDEFYSCFVQVAEQQSMTLAEKLVLIAENEQRVYDAGFAAGQKTGGGTDERFIGLLDGSLTDLVDDSATYLRTNAFLEHQTLKTATLNNVTKAGNNIFKDCAVLESVTMPKLVEAGMQTVMDSKKIKTISMPNLEKIMDNFAYGCPNLESIDFPKLKRVPYWGFRSCDGLKSVNLPVCDSVGGGGLSLNPSLESVNFPNVLSLSDSAFYLCTSLKKVDFQKSPTIDVYAFSTCSVLKILVIRGGSVAVLRNVQAFNKTPFRNGEGGTVYVPQALVESYKTATNWNALESVTFLPIEGSEYE